MTMMCSMIPKLQYSVEGATGEVAVVSEFQMLGWVHGCAFYGIKSFEKLLLAK